MISYILNLIYKLLQIALYKNTLEAPFFREGFFTKRFIDKENKVLSITTNKIFADAQIILGKIIETPHEFANFISLFNKNQNIFLNDDIIKLRNINIEQQLVLNTWIEQHEIYDFNEFNSLARNSRRIFEDEQYLIYMKICSFFITHPKIYRDQAQMIFPPIFIFLEKLNYQDKYQFFAQLTTEHLNTIMISHHNKFFSSFVENFTGLSIVSRNQYSEEFKYIAHYLEKQFTKDLPFNKLIDLSNLFPRDLDDKSLTIEDNLFENIFRQQSINNICLKDYADILKNRNQH